MTRAEKRRKDREDKSLDKTITIKQSELIKLIEDKTRITLKKIVKDLSDLYYLTLKEVMYTKFGFGKARWSKLEEYLNNTLKCVNEKYVSLDDLK